MGPAEAASVLAEILGDLDDFWGDRDTRALHHPVWFHQFGAHAVLVRDRQGTLGGYLLGVVVERLAYVHVVATRQGLRGRGLGGWLYETFLAESRQRGASRAEAITTPTNRNSIAFHERLGFTVTMIAGYAGPGRERALFRRSL